MKCGDVHLALGAEPGATSPEIERHLRECADCAAFQREMQRLDGNIRRALMLDVEALPRRASVGDRDEFSVPARPSWARQWALAASVLLAVVVILVMWGALPSHSLAADIVAHVVSEPFDEPLEVAIPQSAVEEVMRTSALRLDPVNPSIVLARTCFFRGRLVPHFVVRTEAGTAAVMILPGEHIEAPEHFDGNGYKGVLIPGSAGGSIAVLSRSDVDMEQYAGEFRHAVHALQPQEG